MAIKLSHHKLLINNLIFIDGITRTGKTLMAKVLPSLQNFEQVEFADFVAFILAGESFKKVSQDFGEAFIVTGFNELAYSKLLGRKLNFRPSDFTTVKNFKNQKIYEKRFQVEEGNNIISKLKKNKNFFPYITHDVMVNHHLIKNMNFNYKIIELYRNPFDIVFSWWKRGWGTRFQNDPRSITLLSKYNNTLCPWHVGGKERKWIKMNEVEKSASIISKLINNSIKNHKKIKNSKKVLTISYENFLENPGSEIFRICKFLKTKKTKFTKQALIKQKCPGFIDKNKQLERRNFIKSNINKKLYKKLSDLSESYEKNIYNL